LTNAEWLLRETTTLRAIVTRLDDFATRVRASLDSFIDSRRKPG
jgi:hypothetical protein